MIPIEGGLSKICEMLTRRDCLPACWVLVACPQWLSKAPRCAIQIAYWGYSPGVELWKEWSSCRGLVVDSKAKEGSLQSWEKADHICVGTGARTSNALGHSREDANPFQQRLSTAFMLDWSSVLSGSDLWKLTLYCRAGKPGGTINLAHDQTRCCPPMFKGILRAYLQH